MNIDRWLGSVVALRRPVKTYGGNTFPKGEIFHVGNVEPSRTSSHYALVLFSDCGDRLRRVRCGSVLRLNINGKTKENFNMKTRMTLTRLSILKGLRPVGSACGGSTKHVISPADGDALIERGLAELSVCAAGHRHLLRTAAGEAFLSPRAEAATAAS